MRGRHIGHGRHEEEKRPLLNSSYVHRPPFSPYPSLGSEAWYQTHFTDGDTESQVERQLPVPGLGRKRRRQAGWLQAHVLRASLHSLRCSAERGRCGLPGARAQPREEPWTGVSGAWGGGVRREVGTARGRVLRMLGQEPAKLC